MIPILDGDVTFVKGWQERYDWRVHAKEKRFEYVIQPFLTANLPSSPPLARVPYTPEVHKNGPDPEFYDRLYPELDKHITTPVAFALLAPQGWAAERAWFTHEAMIAHGWTSLGWKESSHLDKTWVQFYIKHFDRPLPQNPVFVDADSEHAYVNKTHKGTITYLGCSSIVSSFAKPRDTFEIPKPTGCYKGVAPEKFLHLIRQVRPGALGSMRLLKKEHFKRVYSSPFAHYWLRAKEGVGSADLCEY